MVYVVTSTSYFNIVSILKEENALNQYLGDTNYFLFLKVNLRFYILKFNIRF